MHAIPCAMYFTQSRRSSALSTIAGLGLSPTSSPALSPSGAASISPPSESAGVREAEEEEEEVEADSFVVNMSFQNETVS